MSVAHDRAEIRDYLYGKKPAEIAKAYFNADRGDINLGRSLPDDIVTGKRPYPATAHAGRREPARVRLCDWRRPCPAKGIPLPISEGHVFPKPMIVGTNTRMRTIM